MKTESLRISYFTNMYRPFVGGVTRSIETFTHDLRRLGHHVYIFAPTFDNAQDESNVIRLPAIPKVNHTDFSLPIPLNMKLRLHFENLALNIVHLHHPFFIGELGLRMAKKAGLPTVFTHHTRYEDYAHYLPLEPEVAERMLVGLTVDFCEQCDLVIAPSESMKQIIEERGVQTEVVVIPTGIDTSLYSDIDKLEFRRSIGIAESTPFVFHAGRLAKEKNLSTLLLAFRVIRERVPEAVLVIAGSGPEEDALKKEAEAMDLHGAIRWLPKLTQAGLIPPYSSADLFLFASTSETQGLVVAEAMAGATPVVAIDASGSRDIIRNGIDGILTENSAEALGKAAAELLLDRPRLERYSRAARERAGEFDRRISAEKLVLQYDRLMRIPRARLNTTVYHFEKARRFLRSLIESSIA